MILVVVTILACSFKDNSKLPFRSTVTTTVPAGNPSFKTTRGKVAARDLAPLVSLLSPQKGGIVRGAVFGMKKTDVTELETAKLLSSQDNKLVYSMNATGYCDSCQLLLTYDFNSNGQLDQITIDGYLESTVKAEIMYEELQQHFSNQYGINQQYTTEGYLLWPNCDMNNMGKPYNVYLNKTSSREESGISVQWTTQHSAS